MSENYKRTLYKDLLDLGGWTLLNRSFVKHLGINGALLLSDLISKQNYFIEKGMLGPDGYFFTTNSKITETTSLSKSQIIKNTKLLEKYSLIKKRTVLVEDKGPINYFWLCKPKIKELAKPIGNPEKEIDVYEEKLRCIFNNYPS